MKHLRSTINIGRLLLLAAAVIVLQTYPARADGEHQKLACTLCDGLASHMGGDPAQPFVLRSFEPANGGSALHPALENTGFTYDNALALMAFYGCKRKAEARRIADALVLAVETDRHYHDGRLRNAYRSGPVVPGKEGMLLPGYWSAASNSWIEDGYQVGSATGSTAWGALALLTAYEETEQPAYLDTARKIMDWIHRSTADPQNPGYFGGFFGHEPTPERMTWKSTEHNLDVYAADSWLARLDAGGDWTYRGDTALKFLHAMWNDGEGRFYIGSAPDGNAPNVEMSGLDAELWPLIAVPDFKTKARQVMEWTELNHGVDGGFDFNSDRDGIWLEGTAQAALVLRLVGQPEKAEPLFKTIAAQVTPGGLVYATVNEQLSTGLQVGPNSLPGDFKYYRLPHIGATGWAVLAALDLNPFLGRAGQSLTSKDSPCPPK
ncbi:methylaspartate ammonia-lyase [Rhizobium azibense]|uniref:Methylaspartate ammonia-lyase n=1 Tax=Rhizobium azibense TaxID=1136135 RepID=A0A4R3RZE2_9HYPH|nr:hypothetical protein [Rhizobium azibense]TCU25456.1 methylaspartate ammonia-lyase [Rhizobium azibense]TCU40257.1 methylaspartate ammonia-lyase [Rhizobium azibense]